MGVYERITGEDLSKGRISVHAFMATLQEFALGNMSVAQGAAAFNLDASEQTEASTLLGTITAITNNNAAVQRSMRVSKAFEIEKVLTLAEANIVPFNTAALVRTRLGV